MVFPQIIFIHNLKTSSVTPLRLGSTIVPRPIRTRVLYPAAENAKLVPEINHVMLSTRPGGEIGLGTAARSDGRCPQVTILDLQFS
jgi:hypothetical protein